MKNGKITVGLGSQANADYWLDNFEVLFSGCFKEDIKSFDDAIQYMKHVKKIDILNTKDIKKGHALNRRGYLCHNDTEYAYEVKSNDSYYYIFKLDNEDLVSVIQVDTPIGLRKLSECLFREGKINIIDIDFA